MMEEKNRTEVQGWMLTVWILWAGMVGSLLVYLIIPHVMGEDAKFMELSDSTYNQLRYAFMGLGAIFLVLSQYVRKIMLTVKQGPLV